MTPYMLWLAVFMLADATRRVTEGLLNSGPSYRKGTPAEPVFRALTLEPRHQWSSDISVPPKAPLF